MSYMLADGEGMGWGTRVGKVQGRNHGLKVWGRYPKYYSCEGGRRAGGAQVQIGMPKYFFRFILYIF